jgi:hypothetical protein
MTNLIKNMGEAFEISMALSAITAYALYKHEAIGRWYAYSLNPFFDKTIGKIFDKALGRKTELKALEGYIKKENLSKSLGMIERYKIEEKAYELCDEYHIYEHGMRIAEELGNNTQYSYFRQKRFGELLTEANANEGDKRLGILSQAAEFAKLVVAH